MPLANMRSAAPRLEPGKWSDHNNKNHNHDLNHNNHNHDHNNNQPPAKPRLCST